MGSPPPADLSSGAGARLINFKDVHTLCATVLPARGRSNRAEGRSSVLQASVSPSPSYRFAVGRDALTVQLSNSSPVDRVEDFYLQVSAAYRRMQKNGQQHTLTRFRRGLITARIAAMKATTVIQAKADRK